LLEIRGDVREGLQPSTDDDTPTGGSAEDKVFYVVHPQVDLSDLSSSIPS
jgi:DNA replication licensing factor MCM6